MRNDKSYVYWEGIITVGYKPNGKPQQKSFTGKTQAEVVKKMQEAQQAINSGTYVKPTKTTLVNFCNYYLTDCTAGVKPLTVEKYQSILRTHVAPYFGNRKLQDIRTTDIQTFIKYLSTDGKRSTRTVNGKQITTHGALAPKTIRDVYGFLTVIFNKALEQEVIQKNPCNHVAIPKKEKTEIKPLADEKIGEFLQAIKGDEYELPLKLILFTGLREAEAIGLTWDCIDFKRNQIKVCKQLQSAQGYEFCSTKNGKIRTLTVAPFIMEMLKDIKAKQLNDIIEAGEDWKGAKTPEELKTALVFTRPDGTHLIAGTFYKHCKKALQSIGAEDCRIHALRHSYAVQDLANGGDVKTLQENLGHSSAAITLDIYAHATDEMKKKSADRMQAIYESLTA